MSLEYKSFIALKSTSGFGTRFKSKPELVSEPIAQKIGNQKI